VVLGSIDRGRLRVDVVDRGPGIPPELVEELFQPFRSGKVAGSSGVGLAICRAIVELHSGTIQVDDDHGRGTRFTVFVPV
jgi:signal transduction histidine kinase